MSLRRLLALSALLLFSGCLYHVRERSEEVVADLASRPFDMPPETTAEPPMASTSAADGQPREAAGPASSRATDVQTAAFMQLRDRPIEELKVPEAVPGSEAARVSFAGLSDAQIEAKLKQLYPPLPPLPLEPRPLPGPNGRPYTLADLQRLAADNSPNLIQAASDVEAARGILIQAGAYPNPTLSYLAMPNNSGSATGQLGVGIAQTIKTAGRLRLASAAARKNLDNAQLALRRARSDLSTRVRSAYFALLVAKETLRVNAALARFTDDIYRIQVGLLRGAQAASYEPAALRSSAWTVRLAHKQAIQGYIYAWKQLVTVVNVHNLPLSEVAGRIDGFIPYYDYDTILGRVLRRHTDALTANNGVDTARYNLKLAQVTAYPDVSVSAGWAKELTLAPFGSATTVSVSVPVPIWDTNRGNIRAAEAALVRAGEEPHRVELALTNSLATAYLGYKTNLDALEYYRRYILPDQVTAYRGVFFRRQLDAGSAFGDLVSAQQTLVTDVGTYLGILSSLWSSVVGVADLLQTDDLFQLATPKELPELPDLDHLPGLACPHGAAPLTPHLGK